MCIPLFQIIKLSKIWEVERKGPNKIHLTFEIDSNTQRANELFLEIFLKEGSNPTVSTLFL